MKNHGFSRILLQTGDVASILSGSVTHELVPATHRPVLVAERF